MHFFNSASLHSYASRSGVDSVSAHRHRRLPRGADLNAKDRCVACAADCRSAHEPSGRWAVAQETSSDDDAWRKHRRLRSFVEGSFEGALSVAAYEDYQGRRISLRANRAASLLAYGGE